MTWLIPNRRWKYLFLWSAGFLSLCQGTGLRHSPGQVFVERLATAKHSEESPQPGLRRSVEIPETSYLGRPAEKRLWVRHSPGSQATDASASTVVGFSSKPSLAPSHWVSPLRWADMLHVAQSTPRAGVLLI